MVHIRSVVGVGHTDKGAFWVKHKTEEIIRMVSHVSGLLIILGIIWIARVGRFWQ